MGDVPSTTNSAATLANGAIKAIICEVAVDAAVAALTVEFPWLALPIVRQILRLVLGSLSGRLYIELAGVATFAIIDSQVSGELKDVQDAALALHTAYARGNDEAIAQITKDFKVKFGRLVHLDGSAPIK